MHNKRIGPQLFSATSKLKRIINKSLLEFGVSGAQSRTLNYLYKNKDIKDIYQKDIEAYLAFRGSSVALMIISLIDAGFIVRTISQTDKRKKKLELTAKGEEVAKGTFLVFDAMEKEFIEAFGRKNYDEFIKVLIRFEEILDLKENV